MLKKIMILLIFIINILTISVYAKYSFDYINSAASINIDRTSPSVVVEYSTTEKDVKNVEVTLRVNEDVKDIDGFNKIDNRTYKKIYEENKKEKILVQDVFCNITFVDIDIENIINYPIVINCNKINNNNSQYLEYANKDDTITLEISTDKKYEIDNELNNNKIDILVGDQNVDCGVSIKEISNKEEVNNYEIEIRNILGNGKLKVKFQEKLIIDKNNKFNLETLIDTGIIIDNISPNCTTNEEIKDEGMSEVKVTADEKIYELEGWNIDNSNMELTKEFPSNVSYNIIIKDYAGNEKNVEINVTKATYIKLIYASHNSNIGWTYGYGNYDIAGAKAILEDPNYKTESLAIRIEGNVEEDFLKGQAYVYSYWGPGINARSTDTGHIYGYGYDPSGDIWASLKTTDSLIYLGEKRYFQLGGCGINRAGQIALTGINPIPVNIALEYRYGISSIAFKLKDYNCYDVVYQILEKNNGWINACKNGEPCMVRYDLPMSAIRMAIIPKSESNKLISQWNKYNGTYNLK